MTDLQVYTEFSILPQKSKEEVKEFISFLKMKSKDEGQFKQNQRKFGAAKGFFEMSDDFDEPLEDFQDYM